MGLLSFLHFSFGYFVTVLAWPLLALVYPLCASIRAIETNSFSDSRTLNAYWVVLSLMLLLEHGFMKLFGWPLSWQYIRITIICFLVIPYFDGASYVYKCFIRPLVSTDVQIIINWFQKHKDSPLPRENFLDELDQYVKEYGTEAVEKILTGKFYSRESNVLHEDIKALKITENNEVMTMDQDQFYSRESNVLHEDIKALKITEKNEVMTMDQDQVSQRASKEASSDIQKAKSGTMPIIENVQVQLKSVPDLSATNSNKLKEKTGKAPLSNGMKQQISTKDKENIEKQHKKITNKRTVEVKALSLWCKVCKIRCLSVIDMQSHLKGRKHMAQIQFPIDIQKAKSGTMPIIENVQVQFKNVPDLNTTNSNKLKEKTEKTSLSSGMKQQISTKDKEKIEKQHKKIPNKQTVEVKASSLWCKVCKIHCPGVIDMESHLKGRKHMAQIQLPTTT